MNPTNNDPEIRPDLSASQERQTPTAVCSGSGCGCRSGSPCKFLFVIVLIVAAILFYKFINKPRESEPVIPEETTNSSPANATTPPTEPAVLTPDETETEPATNATTVGIVIRSFEELNTAAADSDAVFVYLPGNDGQNHPIPEATMREAMKTIESKFEMKISLMTLSLDSPDHVNIAGQISLPAVLAMVKGGGMIPVSGEITAPNLVQGFFTAATAGGCASGCR